MTHRSIASDVTGLRSRATIATLAALAAALIAALTFAGPTLADPGLTSPPLHRHFIVRPDETMIPVGPQLCDNLDLQHAFNQFHHNVHHSSGFTLGPQGGAPGLHNDLGAEVAGLPTCG